jgi:20S proteasome alpha/beta subunit
MTVCIAALCDNRKAIILAADKMVGSHAIESEAEIHKVLHLHKDWRVMLAGNDISPAFEIVDSAKKRLPKGKTFTVQEVENAIVESYREQRLAGAASQYLAPRGLTLETFNSAASNVLPESLRLSLDSAIEGYRLELELLVAGFDRNGRGHIFSISDYDNRGAARRHDIPGFQAIGSGSHGANYMMMYRALSPPLPIRWALYLVLEGKYFGELASGVGSRTDLYILRRGKPSIKIKEDTVEDKLIKICQEVEPRSLKQKHVDILNSFKGPAFATIKKLKTKRKGQELAIS